jgi:phosphoglycerol transferase MdoB-like AlkP superfamily enzyme
MLVFPLVLTLITEAAHLSSFVEPILFFAARPSLFVFKVLVVAIIFSGILLIARRAFIASAISAFTFLMFSFIEFFKHQANGMHFNIIDMGLIGNLGDVAGFTSLNLTWVMVLSLVLMFVYTAAFLMLNTQLIMRKRLGISTGLLSLLLFVSVFAFKPTSERVYDMFEVNNSTEHNIFASQKKFNDNMLIANVMSSISQQFDSILLPPSDYSAEKIAAILADAEVNPSNAGTDIIVIMNESFADLREVTGLTIPQGIYCDFDYVKDSPNTFAGRAVVPSIGNGTVQGEFELLFGLPVKSLRNPFVPHNLFRTDGETEATFASVYSQAGYATYYLHPFRNTFYNRNLVYREYGFDRLLFENDFDVEPSRFYDYMDDAMVYRQILALLESAESPSYIHTTTMQNHTPFFADCFDGNEVDFYLSGVRRSSIALADFYDAIMARERPTIVLFIGDHLPVFAPHDDIYGQAGFNNTNCAELYEQTFLIFTNRDTDFSALPAETVSMFYLPHLLHREAFGVTSSFNAFMLQHMITRPIYTDTQDYMPYDSKLDMITYDRTLGERFSKEKRLYQT